MNNNSQNDKEEKERKVGCVYLKDGLLLNSDEVVNLLY